MTKTQAPFSANRLRHQWARPIGQLTGEKPTVAMLDEDLGGLRFGHGYGWEGCLDAPDVFASGGAVSMAPRELDCGRNGEPDLIEWEGYAGPGFAYRCKQ